MRALVGQVDAVIAYADLSPQDIDSVFGTLPLVLLDAAEQTLDALSPSLPRSAVNIDLEPGLAQVIDHLRAAGRSRIALMDITYPPVESARSEVYTRLMCERGLDPAVIAVETVDDDLLAGRRAVEIVRDAPDPPDAIIAFNDMSAFGALKELRVRGVAVPQSCAVVGIDGLKIGVFVEPELTTLRLDFTAFAHMAFDEVVRLCADAAHGVLPQVRKHVSHELVLRESA
ncbi:substrate-binding domain-containing protein [Streptomyces sp. 2.9]|uniref:substrate-binding domain-containing protein n=1 Tax=Streptomyces tritrimontium TaxID=3406573 RepID=UPI003BB6BF0D